MHSLRSGDCFRYLNFSLLGQNSNRQTRFGNREVEFFLMKNPVGLLFSWVQQFEFCSNLLSMNTSAILRKSKPSSMCSP